MEGRRTALLVEASVTSYHLIWGFSAMGMPPNGWVIVENCIRMDDLGVPPIFRTPPYHRYLLIPPNIKTSSSTFGQDKQTRAATASGIGRLSLFIYCFLWLVTPHQGIMGPMGKSNPRLLSFHQWLQSLQVLKPANPGPAEPAVRAVPTSLGTTSVSFDW